MKKILAVLLCVAFAVSLCVTSYADTNHITITPSKKTVEVGEDVTLTIKIVGSGLKGNSAAFSLKPSSGFTVKSGEIIRKDTVLKAFDKKTNKAVCAFSGTVSMEGDFAKIVLTANSKAEGKQKIAIDVIIKPSDITLSNSITFDFSKGDTGKVESSTSSSSGKTSSSSSDKTTSSSSSKTSSSSSDKTTSSSSSKTSSKKTSSSSGKTSSKATSSTSSNTTSTVSGNESSVVSSIDNTESGTETIGENTKAENAKQEKSNNNKLIIIFSCFAAVMIIAVIVIIILNKKKK